MKRLIEGDRLMRGRPLDLCVERLAPADVLRVSGEVDISTSPQFVRALADVLRPDRALIVDIRKVRYIDLRGVKALEEAGARAHAVGQRVVVVSSDATLHRLFAILQLPGHAALVTDIDEAIRLAERTRAGKTGGPAH